MRSLMMFSIFYFIIFLLQSLQADNFCHSLCSYESVHFGLHYQVFLDYTSMTDQSQMESLMKEILEEIRKLWDTLMGLEMELVDQLEVLCYLVTDFMDF